MWIFLIFLTLVLTCFDQFLTVIAPVLQIKMRGFFLPGGDMYHIKEPDAKHSSKKNSCWIEATLPNIQKPSNASHMNKLVSLLTSTQTQSV